MSVLSNIEIIFKEIPDGPPDSSTTFGVRKGTIVIEDVKLKGGEMLVKTLFASVDPYMRGRLRDPSIPSYMPSVVIGQPMEGHVVAEVIKSSKEDFAIGDVVLCFSKWTEYSVIGLDDYAEWIMKIPNAKNSPFPLSYSLGVLGMTGLTAYVGLHKVCEPFTQGETLYISAAAGAVGNIVGQYGKTLGLRVVGSTGDDEKVAYLLNHLGFDAAFNYKKHKDLSAILKKTCPDGIDIFFDNVGGEILDAVLVNCNNFARIAVCGMISQYNRTTNPSPIYNSILINTKRIKMEGFVVFDADKKYKDEFIQTFTKLLTEGKIKSTEGMTKGILSLPDTFVGMLQGKNLGKALVQVAELSI